jgi:hypothetical protein
VAEVDPGDDTLDRWVVQWYRFDPGRHERRHTIVAAFDNPREMEAEVVRLTERLRERVRAGVSDDAEWISGVHHCAGYKDEMAAQRAVRAAWRHRRSP